MSIKIACRIDNKLHDYVSNQEGKDFTAKLENIIKAASEKVVVGQSSDKIFECRGKYISLDDIITAAEKQIKYAEDFLKSIPIYVNKSNDPQAVTAQIKINIYKDVLGLISRGESPKYINYLSK